MKLFFSLFELLIKVFFKRLIQIQLLGDFIKVISCATTSNCVSIKDGFSSLVKQRKETELIVQCIQRTGIYSLAIGTENSS